MVRPSASLRCGIVTIGVLLYVCMQQLNIPLSTGVQPHATPPHEPRIQLQAIPPHTQRLQPPSTTPANNMDHTTHLPRFFMEQSYLDAGAQFNKGIPKQEEAHLESLPRRSKSLRPHKSKHNVDSLDVNYHTQNFSDALRFEVNVKDKKRLPVTGCSFRAQTTFVVDGERRVTLCGTKDLLDGNYSIVCLHPGSGITGCVKVQIQLAFCYHEAFKSTILWKYVVVDKISCFAPSGRMLSPTKALGQVVSWSLDAHGHCDKLYFDNILQKPLSSDEACECADQYDHIYFMGTSHLGHFSDYLMHTCRGWSMKGKLYALRHGNLDVGNLHFRAGTFIKDLYMKMKQNLDEWLGSGNSSRVAIVFQTGSWDFFRIGISYTIEIGLKYYEKLIIYIKSRIDRTACSVGFHIVAQPPRPDRHAVDRIAISVYNAKLQMIARKHNVSFIDEFAVMESCTNDFPHVDRNRHHYLQGHGNRWEGKAGMTFCRGVLMSTLCPKK